MPIHKSTWRQCFPTKSCRGAGIRDVRTDPDLSKCVVSGSGQKPWVLPASSQARWGIFEC